MDASTHKPTSSAQSVAPTLIVPSPPTTVGTDPPSSARLTTALFVTPILAWQSPAGSVTSAPNGTNAVVAF